MVIRGRERRCAKDRHRPCPARRIGDGRATVIPISCQAAPFEPAGEARGKRQISSQGNIILLNINRKISLNFIDHFQLPAV
jgi:hypothetical protein